MMGVFNDAIGVVDKQSKRISQTLEGLGIALNGVGDAWKSPAADTFNQLAAEFKTDAGHLDDLLADILSRMRQSYHNYEEVEHKAEQNLGNQRP